MQTTTAVRHLTAFRYSDAATDEDANAFETALLCMPANPELGIENYRLWSNARRSTGFHVLVEATFADSAAYVKYRDHPAHRSVCPDFRRVLFGRAALQCTADFPALATGAVVLFLKLHGDAAVAVAAKVRAAGSSAAPGASSVLVTVDLRIPSAAGQSPNKELAVVANLAPGSDSEPRAWAGLEAALGDALEKDQRIGDQPFFRVTARRHG